MIFGVVMLNRLTIYMIVNDNGKIAVINFFKTKNEALSWMNSLN